MTKNRFLTVIALFFGFVPGLFSQSNNGITPDTVITKSNQRVVCHIIKLTDTKIVCERKTSGNPSIDSIPKSLAWEIRWGNGSTELIVTEEPAAKRDSMRAYFPEIKSAVKFYPLGLMSDKVCFGYERVIKENMSGEVIAGVINNDFTRSMGTSLFSDATALSVKGFEMTVGVKFVSHFNLMNTNDWINGDDLDEDSPLHGFFFKPEILYSNFLTEGITRDYFNLPPGSNPMQVSDMRTSSFAFMIELGRQRVYKSVCFGYSLGIGYATSSVTYSNPLFASYSIGSSNYNSVSANSDNINASYMYSHYYLGGLAVNATFFIGYIF